MGLKKRYTLCNHREFERHGELFWLRICLLIRGHKGEHDFSYSPYGFEITKKARTPPARERTGFRARKSGVSETAISSDTPQAEADKEVSSGKETTQATKG
jgi:hypothetical protein